MLKKTSYIEKFLENIGGSGGDPSGNPHMQGTKNFGKGGADQLASAKHNKATQIISDQSEEENQASLPGLSADSSPAPSAEGDPGAPNTGGGGYASPIPTYTSDNAPEKYTVGSDRKYTKGDGYVGKPTTEAFLKFLKERDFGDALYSTMPGVPRNNFLSKPHRYLQPNSPEDETADNRTLNLIPGLEGGTDPQMLARWNSDQVKKDNRQEGEFNQLVKPVDWMDEFEIDDGASDMFGDYKSTKELIPGQGHNKEKEKVINKPDGSSSTLSGKQLSGPLNNTGWGYAGKLEKQHNYIKSGDKALVTTEAVDPQQFNLIQTEVLPKVMSVLKQRSPEGWEFKSYFALQRITDEYDLVPGVKITIFYGKRDLVGLGSTISIFCSFTINESEEIELTTRTKAHGVLEEKNYEDMFDQLRELENNESFTDKLYDFQQGFLIPHREETNNMILGAAYVDEPDKLSNIMVTQLLNKVIMIENGLNEFGIVEIERSFLTESMSMFDALFNNRKTTK